MSSRRCFVGYGSFEGFKEGLSGLRFRVWGLVAFRVYGDSFVFLLRGVGFRVYGFWGLGVARGVGIRGFRVSRFFKFRGVKFLFWGLRV